MPGVAPYDDLVVRDIGRLVTWHGPVVERAAVVIRAGRVDWTGPMRDLPAEAAGLPELDAAGAAVLPGFVDAHTHAVWAGTRREEFLARMRGERYDGGGIVTTVAATTAATAPDVDTVVVGGRTVVSGGCHVLGDVGRLLHEAIAPLREDP